MTQKTKKVNIVGAGLSGAIIARKLAEQGYQINIFEKRDHIAGNVYDYEKNGILIHKYGPHIFHTSKQNVIDFIDKYWELNGFQNVVEGFVDGKLVPIPFNFKSIDICFPEEKEQIKELLLKEYGQQESVTILELRKNENEVIQKVADFVYKNLFLNYTTKMWGLDPNEIDPSVTARIPINLSYNNRYFKDSYEGLPKDGYTKTVARILDHPNIFVNLNVDANSKMKFENGQAIFENDKDSIIIYTGALDSLFNDKFGSLKYRSLFFKFEELKVKKFQETAVVNYPADPEMTRITEYKNMTYQTNDDLTVISKEFPGAYSLESTKWNEPYYPLATDVDRNLYNKYKDIALQYKNLYLAGRMATYRYLNMDQAIEEALTLADKIISDYE